MFPKAELHYKMLSTCREDSGKCNTVPLPVDGPKKGSEFSAEAALPSLGAATAQ